MTSRSKQRLLRILQSHQAGIDMTPLSLVILIKQLLVFISWHVYK